MKYAVQVQGALDRLDQSLRGLRNLIKRGQQKEALDFMENGSLKDCFEDLQNIITVAGGPGSNLGASGTSQTGTFNR